MTRHYSIRAFFRQMPNALLARYFAARGVLADFDFTGHAIAPQTAGRRDPRQAVRYNSPPFLPAENR